MSLLPDSASFAERVQDCFLAFRGNGLMLSALDAELIESWDKQQIPFEVIARGIRRAAETRLWDARPGEHPLKSLRNCRRHVEAEFKKHVKRSAGRTDSPQKTTFELEADTPFEPLPLQRHKKLLASLRKLAKQPSSIHDGLISAIDVLSPRIPNSFADAEKNEERLYLHLFRTIPFEVRLKLLKEAREVSPTSGSMSFYAQKLSRRFHRAFVLRRHFALPAFW